LPQERGKRNNDNIRHIKLFKLLTKRLYRIVKNIANVKFVYMGLPGLEYSSGVEAEALNSANPLRVDG
jgi:hypothetical protein